MCPPTPASTLIMAKEIAEKVGIKYVYIGNMAPYSWRKYLLSELQRIIDCPRQDFLSGK